MATYSVFARDDSPADEPDDTSLGRAVLPYRSRTPDADALAPPTAGDESSSLRAHVPGVVLQLPDLTLVDESEAEWWPRLSQRLFWVGIAAGALIALTLVCMPKKQHEAPPLEQAPSWTGHAPPQNPTSMQTPAPNFAPPATLSTTANTATTPTTPTPPPVDRTALGGNVVWDGHAPAAGAEQHAPATPPADPAVGPGEAAPTGRIINTW